MIRFLWDLFYNTGSVTHLPWNLFLGLKKNKKSLSVGKLEACWAPAHGSLTVSGTGCKPKSRLSSEALREFQLRLTCLDRKLCMTENWWCLSSHMSGYKKKKKKKILFFGIRSARFNWKCLSVLRNMPFFLPNRMFIRWSVLFSGGHVASRSGGALWRHALRFVPLRTCKFHFSLSVLRISAITGGAPDEFQIKRPCKKAEPSTEIWTLANVSASLFCCFFPPLAAKESSWQSVWESKLQKHQAGLSRPGLWWSCAPPWPLLQNLPQK